MAKAKSKKITIEDALLPVDEQPYEVPENWCWIYWGNAGEFIAGSGFKNSYQGFAGYDIPFYKVGSLKYSDNKGYLFDDSNSISEKMRLELKATLIPVNSVLFAKIGEAIRLNRRSMNSIPCCIDNNMMAFVPKACDYKYSYYWSKGLELYEYTNATTVPAIRKSDLEKIPFPLPPLAEQQRIVEQIESLFSKLDEAKEKAQEALESFDERKSSILQKAFSGELTKKWRLDKGVNESRKTFLLSKCCIISSGGTPSRKIKEYYEGNIPWIKTGEIDWNDIYDAEEHISQEAIDNSSAKIYDPGAVLVAMYGMGITRGKAAILKNEAATNQAVCVLQPNSDLYNKYLFYYFMSNYWEIREKSVGGNQLNLSGTIIGKFVIDIPSFEEQQIIVSMLDGLLEKETKAKELLEVVLDQIDLMKKTILAKAYRGVLGTNDLSEESSIELLKKVLEKG